MSANTDVNATNPTNPIVQIKPLGFPWATMDPFLFCAYHDDAYPEGNTTLGPQPSLSNSPVRFWGFLFRAEGG